MRALLVAFVVLVLTSACSSSSSPPDTTSECINICNKDSQLMCTDITNCTLYCDAVEGIATSGNCVTQINAFMDCANGATVCQAKTACSSQDTDFSSCASQYCDANTTDTNCTQLSNSL
jgi:hypothetical protein